MPQNEFNNGTHTIIHYWQRIEYTEWSFEPVDFSIGACMEKLKPDEIKKCGFIKDPYYNVVAMMGPFLYNKEEIARQVINREGKGNYRTGTLDAQGRFIPRYVGRGIVFNRLNDHIDEGFVDEYFEFLYEEDEIRSYGMESADYDYYGIGHKQLRNAEHPKKPDGRDDLKCPYCGE